MGITLPEWPKWIETAIQGLAFWIGHRHSLFKHYPLTEGALVAELCNLIQANLPTELVLLPEQIYKNLIIRDSPYIHKNSRVDLAICQNAGLQGADHQNLAQYVDFAFEVKRATASKSLIDEDIRRLFHFINSSVDTARAFLIVTSEACAPRRFVRDGKSILGRHYIPNMNGHYRIRRTCKAAASFSGKESAHYISLVEVFKNGKKK